VTFTILKRNPYRKRAGLREFDDAQQEYEATGDKEALIRRHNAIRGGKVDMADFERANDELIMRAEEDKAKRESLLKKHKISGWREEEKTNG